MGAAEERGSSLEKGTALRSYKGERTTLSLFTSPACSHRGSGEMEEESPATHTSKSNSPTIISLVLRQHRARASPGHQGRRQTGLMSKVRTRPSEAGWVSEAHHRGLEPGLSPP